MDVGIDGIALVWRLVLMGTCTCVRMRGKRLKRFRTLFRKNHKMKSNHVIRKFPIQNFPFGFGKTYLHWGITRSFTRKTFQTGFS